MFNKIVTDGIRVFENYQWNENKEIVSKLTGKTLKGDKSQNYCNYCLYEKDGKFRRERTVLLKGSFPEMFEPKDKQNYIDVFGMEEMYCFRKDNPNIVWSKARKEFIKIKKTKCGHLFFAPKMKSDKWAKQKYIHVMVWQSYNKKKYDGKKFNLHHISFDKQQNQIENILLIPATYHHSFHNQVKLFEEGKIDYNKLLNVINNYRLSTQAKQILINSLDVYKLVSL